MAVRRQNAHTELNQAAVHLFAVNDRVNQLLLEQLDPAAWRATSPGKVRTIAAIFSHMHNVRAKWIRLTAPHLNVPPQLNRTRCTPQQASAALAESAAGCAALLMEVLGDHKGTIYKFRRDGWAPPQLAGPEVLFYMLCHEAHHRGQVCMLAHQLGFPLPREATSAMWNWERLGRARPLDGFQSALSS